MWRFLLLSLLCLPQAQTTLAAPPAQRVDESYTGSAACASCHAEEYTAWQGSHHDLAMQVADHQTVLGDFNNARFSYNKIEHRFFRIGEEFWVSTDGPDGRLTEYQVQYVFGVHPLQQYLLRLPGGRLHALSIAWDSRTAEEGGQRWYHLYPQESIGADDPLHWTGPYQNWNTRCAECHSTDLEKNFDPATGIYSTSWVELNVACEACHGPGNEHALLAAAGTLTKHADAGLAVNLQERGAWHFQGKNNIAQRRLPLQHSQQIESCGRCHSRRGTLGKYEYDKDLLDTHRPSLLEDRLYHADGQIEDEVYVYGSFLQSKMYQAGVVCSNCHDPHSNQLRAPGNGVCSQCHRADSYATAQHHHHPADSDGALCVNCHMPATTYMGVDPRRDHSMRIPRPDLSVVIGTPNACNQCHTDQQADWSLEQLRAWGVSFADTSQHPARTLHQARSGDARAIPQLQQLALDPGGSSIWRASAMVELGGYASQEAYQAALQLLQSPDPLLRMSAVRALEFVPVQQLFRVLNPRLIDPSAAVRMEVARVLAAMPEQQLDESNRALLQKLFAEYLATLGRHADMPGTQLQMGSFLVARQAWQPAERAYQSALQLNPQFIPAKLNLADLYRQLGREDDARLQLQEAIKIAPGEAPAHHALGLLETRVGNRDLALAHLKAAAELEQSGIRYRYVYAIALHDSGSTTAALNALRLLHRGAPENPDIVLALVTYNQLAGRLPEARRYAETLKQLLPDNPQLQNLYDSLR